ncbi:hypothetical protein I6G56_30470 [Burkholderia humptydooensis]|uniref:Uncharacterized protein n=2 Tax=Burkholderia humptydooensis TaxID=430531 RepID=A0A7U4STN0_9BURK|nr:hypothetical protein BW21_4052 [Burkholderia sp. 2002721687]ALX44946.1 hypothetical protein AQ610_20650 [Burkholderia humptydooensis]EIP85240.1 hypothetical protein A33K_18190 [Burkholderia humptydooensis MSMB43]QPS46406.1 hypothetical protein I6G56_30470 [Burkholderia humptydooensis]
MFAQEITRRLKVPLAGQRVYGERLRQMLGANGLDELAREYVVLVDRARNGQAAFIYFRTTRNNAWRMIGASPAATGLPGQYGHFVTPSTKRAPLAATRGRARAHAATPNRGNRIARDFARRKPRACQAPLPWSAAWRHRAIRRRRQ